MMTTTRDTDPRTMSETELTAEIDAIGDRLTILYAARRGQKLPATTPGVCWQWCRQCGQRMVDGNAGKTDCATCFALLVRP